jgi:hypothetical protein
VDWPLDMSQYSSLKWRPRGSLRGRGHGQWGEERAELNTHQNNHQRPACELSSAPINQKLSAPCLPSFHLQPPYPTLPYPPCLVSILSQELIVQKLPFLPFPQVAASLLPAQRLGTKFAWHPTLMLSPCL